MPCRIVAFAALLLLAAPLRAQDRSGDTITLTLDEAIQIALLNNYAMEAARLDLEQTYAQVREGIGGLLPNVVATSGYTRNLKTANPFAGSSAGTLFNSFGFVGWLAYNEEARTDDDPSTHTLTFDEYSDRIDQGLADAGLSLDTGENPFAVANQFQTTVSVSQTVFDADKFSTVSALRYLKVALENAVDRQQQLVVDRVRQSFYQTLLYQEQAQVAARSVERTRHTAEEASRRVAQGVAPMVERLGAEVQLVNLETQLVQIENQAQGAMGELKLALGMPIDRALILSGSLNAGEQPPYLTVSVESAFERAVSLRPDLRQLEALRDIARVNVLASRGSRLPTLSAVANFSYIGAVPSNRTFGKPDSDDPFLFTRSTNGFFDSAYWQPSISVGFNLRWPLFEGFSRRARIRQLKTQLDRAELDLRRTIQEIRLDIGTALRRLTEARAQIMTQERNITVAELNYSHAKARLSQGIGTSMEERTASEQLDQSQINYLQAVYNYLMAQSAFETAAGIPLARQSDFQLTSNFAR